MCPKAFRCLQGVFRTFFGYFEGEKFTGNKVGAFLPQTQHPQLLHNSTSGLSLPILQGPDVCSKLQANLKELVQGSLACQGRRRWHRRQVHEAHDVRALPRKKASKIATMPRDSWGGSEGSLEHAVYGVETVTRIRRAQTATSGVRLVIVHLFYV